MDKPVSFTEKIGPACLPEALPYEEIFKSEGIIRLLFCCFFIKDIIF